MPIIFQMGRVSSQHRHEKCSDSCVDQLCPDFPSKEKTAKKKHFVYDLEGARETGHTSAVTNSMA